jgi:hypothetical protein
MGFLKKITRPISRVLDKVIPNEIKPALPFLAAAAPFMAPGIMGTGMLQRALVSGGLNLGAQLAQEGSEGEFDALSVALASGIGALSAPGSAGGRTIGDSGASYSQVMGGDKLASAGTQSAGEYLRGLSNSGGITDQALNFLGTGADKLVGLSEGLAADGIFSKAGAKALSIPLTQGTMDLASAEARRLEKQQAIDDALASADGLADDAARASAIRNAMTAYGFFTDEEIEDTISSAGYQAGGRVGLMMGGDPDFSGIKGAVESVDKNMRADRAGDFFRLRDEAIQKGDSDKIKEIESDFFREFGMVMPKMMAGGELEKNIFLQGGPTIERLLMNKEEKKQDKDKIKKELEELGIFKRKKVAEGGLMNLGGKEMDLRKGGFVPIGKKERADDVPARLSKNEFVMTADAVRAAGGGSVNEGAKRMYETMNRLEARA